jgi:DNA repair exonuclease SbcCD ATPase subunit
MQRLSWGGCFSYGPKNTIELNNATITQLIGENGSGKSSIPLILQEVAFNKNSKGVKKADIANREIGDGKYWIELEFELNDDQYKISVNRASSLKVKVYKNEEDISSHTATETFKTIEELIGIDFKVFVQLIYQSVTDGLSFLTATDTVRKKFLIDLFNLDEYSKLYEKSKEKLQDITKEITSIKGSISTLEKMLSKAGEAEQPKEYMDVPEEPQYPEQIATLEAKLRDIIQVNKKITQNNELKRILKNITYDSSILSKDLIDTNNDTLALGEITAKVNSAKALITKMAKLSDSCPTCGQHINIEKEKTLKQEAEQDLAAYLVTQEEIKEKLEANKIHNAAVLKARKARDEKEDLLQRIDNALDAELVDAENIKAEIKELTYEYEDLKDEYSKAIMYNNKVKQHNDRLEILAQQRQETQEELEFENVRLENLTRKQSIYEILKKALSTNGLVAFKLENLVKDIEEAANEYLLELSDGRFSLMFTISGDKLNVVLLDNNVEIDISPLSSGELARVNIATLLAIRRIMSDISKTQINILFLDEVMNVLDEYGREKLIEILMAETSLNTFLVSHGWSHPLLAKVIVQKVDGISQLKEQ